MPLGVAKNSWYNSSYNLAHRNGHCRFIFPSWRAPLKCTKKVHICRSTICPGIIIIIIIIISIIIIIIIIMIIIII